MTDPVQALVVFGAETHPPDSLVANIAVPIAILVFFGGTYLLVRSNLGTKRGYLVVATTFFGFIMLFSLFWGFGGWGTPQASGPTQLPGQPIDELEPRWIPFDQDSRLANRSAYDVVQNYPEGFEVYEGGNADETLEAVNQAIANDQFETIEPLRESLVDFDEEIALVEDGTENIRSFFSQGDVLDGEASLDLVGELDEPVEIGFAEAANGDLVMAVTYQEFDQESFEVVEDGETYTAFGYYERGAPLMPSLVFFIVALVLFALHGWLLDRDERLERRERERLEQTEEPERVPEPV